jgi:hypothetical protein
LYAALEIEVVVDFLDGRFVREAVEEIERPDAGFQLVRRLYCNLAATSAFGT